MKDVDMAIVETAAAVKGAYDLTKRALEIADKLESVELKEIILALKEEALERREEIMALKQQISKLTEEQQASNELEWEGLIYFFKSEGKQNGGICPRCYDADKKLVRIASESDSSSPDGLAWRCKNCGHFYSRS